MQGFNKKDKIMKDIIKDYMSEDFTMKEWCLYGVMAPLVLIVLCLLAG